jgi:magnesium chelatase family protein
MGLARDNARRVAEDRPPRAFVVASENGAKRPWSKP